MIDTLVNGLKINGIFLIIGRYGLFIVEHQFHIDLKFLSQFSLRLVIPVMGVKNHIV